MSGPLGTAAGHEQPRSELGAAALSGGGVKMARPASRTTPRSTVAAVDAATRISELLDSTDAATTGTSMRIPVALHEAASIAVAELGVAPSTTALAVDALRNWLEALVMQAALDAHYERHPGARPSLAELAIAAAEQDGNPLASQPRLIRKAAKAVAARHPEADADAVLLWAEALASTAA